MKKLKIRLISNFSVNGYDKECQIASHGEKIWVKMQISNLCTYDFDEVIA